MEAFVILAAAAAYAEERRALTNARRRLRDETDPFDVSEPRFMAQFRLSKGNVRYVCDALRHSLRRQRSHGLSVESQVLAALRFFAVGSYQGCVGQDFFLSLSQSSVCNSIHAVARGIVEVLGQAFVSFPETDNSKTNLKQRFRQANGIKGVIGCIDCTQIAIFKPSDREEAYVNHKGYHSLNVEAVASYDLKFLAINARYPGSVHDSFIWKYSPVKEAMVQGWQAGDHTSWLLGDSGYPLEPWLMTPVLHAREGPEMRYNTAHSRTRCCVERAFGVLKNTFRCLLKHRTLHCTPEHVAYIVTACSVLHNIRISTIPEVVLEMVDGDDGNEQERQEDIQGDRQREANIIRNSLIRNFE